MARFPKKDMEIKKYLDYLYRLNYKQRPVSIEEFVSNPYYIGRVTKNGKAIYPAWMRALKELLSDDTKYLAVFTGAIGIGKTWIACAVAIPYILYRVSCLKDPWGYFDLAESGKFDVAFFNLTKSLSSSRGFQYMQNSLMHSAWFYKDGGGIIKGQQNKVMELPLFNWVLASPYSKGFGMIGTNLLCGIMDEVDSPTESEGQKKRVLQAYDSARRRFQSRFEQSGRSLGRFFLVSSKTDELSFLESYVEEMRGDKSVYVVDLPLWEVKSNLNYSGKTFKVIVGDAYTPSRIIEAEAEVENAIANGYQVIEVPVEYRIDFERDIIGALRDLAGISVRGQRKYKLFPSQSWIKFDETKEDPVTVGTLQVGLKDDFDWLNVLDLNKIRIDFKVPRYLHMDIGVSGDALAIASSAVAGWTEVDEEQEEGAYKKKIVPIVETDFILRVKAKSEDRIPLSQMRKFIISLKRAGLNIVLFTADLLLASEDTLQILTKAGIQAKYFSVDKNVQASLDFRNLVFEGRWLCHKHEWLFFEMKHIEYDRDRNRVDHPDRVKEVEVLNDGTLREYVMEGSKDCFDAVVGSVYNCLKNAKKKMSVQEMKDMADRLRTRQESHPDHNSMLLGMELMEDKSSVLRKALKKMRSRRRI